MSTCTHSLRFLEVCEDRRITQCGWALLSRPCFFASVRVFPTSRRYGPREPKGETRASPAPPEKTAPSPHGLRPSLIKTSRLMAWRLAPRIYSAKALEFMPLIRRYTSYLSPRRGLSSLLGSRSVSAKTGCSAGARHIPACIYHLDTGCCIASLVP